MNWRHVPKNLVFLILIISQQIVTIAKPVDNDINSKTKEDADAGVQAVDAALDNDKSDAVNVGADLSPNQNIEKQDNDKLLLQKHSENEETTSEQLTEEHLKPVDHLEGVRLEHDGRLNKDIHKETFLGNHEEIEDDPTEIAESKLKDIIFKVDVNQDGLLSPDELEVWIVKKVQEHFDEALEENEKIFKHLDPDNDGLVDWKEYYMHFLLAKGYPVDKAKQHVEDYDVVEMKMKDRDQLIKYKFRWTDADKPPMDNKLSQSEFLAFRHPEQSPEALEQMMDAIFASLDDNDDERLTEAEFVALAVGEVEDSEQEEMDEEWQEERREEFRNAIDKNHDGIATKEELLAYLDPRNPQHAKAEVDNLLTILDNDKDGNLNFKEIMDNKHVFLNSKVINVGRSLHDEF